MFEKEFVDRLKELYEKGKTYDDIAELTGLSRAFVACTINGSRPPKNLTVDALAKAFPNMTISLSGDKTKISVRENSGNVVGVNHGTVGGCLDWAMDKILGADELSADEKIKVLKVLKK